MEESIERIIISNEDEAFLLLQLALENQISETTQITFKGWPVFNLTIEGKDFNGSIPTRIMPPILDLQKEIYRVYCRARYNSEDTKKLTNEERKSLELVVTIRQGSTKFITDLFNALNEVIKNSNMDSNQVLILLIAISALITANFMWKDWLRTKEREHGQDVTVELSKQETERHKLVVEALTRQSELKHSQQAISDFQSSLSKKLSPADQLKVNDEPIINGERAIEIVPPPKQTPKEIRLDGNYSINVIKFPINYGEPYRFSVTSSQDNKSFMVDVAPDLLTQDQIEILKEGSFRIKHIRMHINAREHRGQITDARVFSIEWPQPK